MRGGFIRRLRKQMFFFEFPLHKFSIVHRLHLRSREEDGRSILSLFILRETLTNESPWSWCFCFYNSSNEDTPAVIILDQLNCLASLADIFDFSQLEKNSSWYVLVTFSCVCSGVTMKCHAMLWFSSLLLIPWLGQLPTTEIVNIFDGFHSNKPPVDVLELSSLKYRWEITKF